MHAAKGSERDGACFVGKDLLEGDVALMVGCVVVETPRVDDSRRHAVLLLVDDVRTCAMWRTTSIWKRDGTEVDLSNPL